MPSTAAAKASTAAANISVGEPAGFSNLTAPQRAVVDVYFGGRKLGEAQVTYRPGSLTFEDPASVAALIPNLADATAVRRALADRSLPGNARLVCSPGADRQSCGRLSPDVAGVIFDQDRFRVDIFVNPRLLEVIPASRQRYLPQPESGVAILNSLAAVLSGSNSSSKFYNIQDRLLVGDADRRLRAEMAYASGYGVQAERLAIEIDKPGRRYTAGTFWAPGTGLVGRRKMVGIGVETQIDTRLDKEEMRGNPLIVFLGQRSRVDILRDGRVLASRIYEAGNQGLDTASLPDGTYEVVLRIEELSGSRREERKFFTKNARIAAVGQKIAFAYAGVLANDFKRGLVSPTGTPFVQAGLARRFGPHLALDGTVMVTDKVALGEFGGYLIGRQAQLRIAVLGATNGTYGGLVQIGSTGNSRLGYNFDLRHIRNGSPNALLDPAMTNVSQDQFSGGTSPALPNAYRSFSQVSGNVTYSLPSAQLSLSGSYRRQSNERRNFSIGPSLRWEVLRRGPARLTFNADYARTDRGHSGFVGLALQVLGRNTTVGGNIGARSQRENGDSSRSGPVGGVNASWQDEDVAGAEVGLGAAYEHDTDHELINGTAHIRGRAATLTADVAHTFGQGQGNLQYSVGFQTSTAIRGGKIAFEGRNESESMAIVKVNGAPAESRFEVLVNDGSVGTVRSGSSLAIALPAYHQYDVRIRALGGDLTHYDSASRRISLYPGNVARLEWQARRVVAVFGRLVEADGTPVANAPVTGPEGIGETDERGFFQIEAGLDTALDVRRPDGGSCRVSLPQITTQTGYASLGTLICRPQGSDIMLTSVQKR